MTLPSIKDAAVIGLPDEDAGELPLAYVVRNEGDNVTEEEVKKFVAGESLSLKSPAAYVYLILCRYFISSKTTERGSAFYQRNSQKPHRKNFETSTTGRSQRISKS